MHQKSRQIIWSISLFALPLRDGFIMNDFHADNPIAVNSLILVELH
jgi:hypothetical protein